MQFVQHKVYATGNDYRLKRERAVALAFVCEQIVSQLVHGKPHNELKKSKSRKPSETIVKLDRSATLAGDPDLHRADAVFGTLLFDQRGADL